MLSGLAEDPDGNVAETPPITDMYPTITGATWQWARTMTPDMMDSWMDITGATDAAYMVMDADEGYHLRATAMYADGEGMGKMASMQTMMVTTAPEFADSEVGARSVAENTGSGMEIGAPVTATDANDDTLTYALGGTDAASFNIDPETGQLMTLAALDYEAMTTYDGHGHGHRPRQSQATSIDGDHHRHQRGRDGNGDPVGGETDALTMAPQVGGRHNNVGAVMDPDGGVTGESWQWARTMTPANMMASWMDITGATDAAYTVMDADEGYHLRVMATYTDAAGTDMAMEDSPATMMVTAMMTVPMFDSETATREVAENTEAGMEIGAPVTATDANDDTLTYALGGTDTASFDIDTATGQLMTKEALDYETKVSYSVTVTANDSGGLSDSIDVTITVTNEDEMGRVTFWRDGADATAAAIMVGDMLSGLAEDPDGNVAETPPITDMYPDYNRRHLAVGQDHDAGHDG